jgi:hypothetical protein
MKKIITAAIAIIMGGFMLAAPAIVSNPVFAEGSCVETAVLGGTKCRRAGKDLVEDANGTINCSCDNGSGSSVVHILLLVVDVMSAIIGILAAIGISIVGVQYLTAGGSEEKTRKAKRRLLEIVIGIIVYVLLYVILKWLLPTFR